MQDMRNMHNMLNIHNMQIIQNMQNMQCVQSMRNVQNLQNIQSIQNRPNMPNIPKMCLTCKTCRICETSQCSQCLGPQFPWQYFFSHENGILSQLEKKLCAQVDKFFSSYRSALMRAVPVLQRLLRSFQCTLLFKQNVCSKARTKSNSTKRFY